MQSALKPEVFRRLYRDFAAQNPKWNEIPASVGQVYQWDAAKHLHSGAAVLPEFQPATRPHRRNQGRPRRWAFLATASRPTTFPPPAASRRLRPAGKYLIEHGVNFVDFNSYGSRRGNDRVMTRGTFANVRIKNLMTPGVEGGVTKFQPGGGQMSIFDAAVKYARNRNAAHRPGGAGIWHRQFARLGGQGHPFARRQSRWWRKASSAFTARTSSAWACCPCNSRKAFPPKPSSLDGTETYDVLGLGDNLKPQQDLTLRITRASGATENVTVRCRIDTPIEIDYYQHGGILPYVLRQLATAP